MLVNIAAGAIIVPSPNLSKGVDVRILSGTLRGLAIFGCFGAALAQPAADPATAESLMKKSGCFKCHSITAKKDGPAYKEVAAKYRGKPDAESKLFTHLTTSPKIKVDGQEERHDSLMTKDDAQIRNVIRFILSR